MSLAILCSGQGAQHPAMLDMIADHPAAAEVIKTGEEALGLHLRDSLAQRDEMFRNAIAQPLICLAQLALWTALRPDTQEPGAFCGYSVGELGAYACAGAFDAGELARIAAARAALMDKAAATAHGGMLALQGLRRDEVDRLCKDHRAWVAIAIGEEEFVIGGEDAALEKLSPALAEKGARLTRLKVGVASHTPLLSAAVQPFRELLAASSMTSPATPVVAGIDAAWVVRRDGNRKAGTAVGSHHRMGELSGRALRTRLPRVPGTRSGARAGAHDAGAVRGCGCQVGGRFSLAGWRVCVVGQAYPESLNSCPTLNPSIWSSPI
jgi:[acyl-carrier-protein] S-malonyltransferase